MKGALRETFEAIDALKPYKGGNDLLWNLHELNNIEKHRLLITVGAMFQSFNFGAHASAWLADWASTQPDNPFAGKEIPHVDLFLGSTSTDALSPLKVGDELFIDAPDAKVNEGLQFGLNVALYEPDVLKAKALLETVQELARQVEGIVTALIPRLN
jgi:hypothetical protein